MQRFLHSKCFYDLIGYKNIHNLCQGLHTQIIFLCAKPNDTLQNAGSSFASPHHPRFTCVAKSAPSWWQGTGRNRVYSTWNAWRSSKHAGFDTRPVISRKLCELSTHFFHIRLPCASTQFRGKNVFCVKICIEFPFRDSNTFFACLPNTPFPHKSNGDLTRR